MATPCPSDCNKMQGFCRNCNGWVDVQVDVTLLEENERMDCPRCGRDMFQEADKIPADVPTIAVEKEQLPP